MIFDLKVQLLFCLISHVSSEEDRRNKWSLMDVYVTGDEADTVPQEEVEDLVIQLCELVNEKNDLFRKQTELMYMYVTRFVLLIRGR